MSKLIQFINISDTPSAQPTHAQPVVKIELAKDIFTTKIYSKPELKLLFISGYNTFKQTAGITLDNLDGNICFTLAAYNYIIRLRYLLYSEIDNLVDITEITNIIANPNMTSDDIDKYNKYLIIQSFIELINENKFFMGNLNNKRVKFIRSRLNQIKFYVHIYTYIIVYLEKTFTDVKNICNALTISETTPIANDAKKAKANINLLIPEYLFSEKTYIKNGIFDKLMFLGTDGIEEYITNITHMLSYCKAKNMTASAKKLKEIIDVIDHYNTNDTLLPGISVNTHAYYDPKVYKNIFMLNSTCKDGGSALTTSSFILGAINSNHISIVNMESLSVKITTSAPNPITGIITPIPMQQKVNEIFNKLHSQLTTNAIKQTHYLVLELTIELEYIMKNINKFKVNGYTLCGLLLKCGAAHSLFATCYDTNCDNDLFTVINDNMRLSKDIKNYAQYSSWGPFCDKSIKTKTTEALIYEISQPPADFLIP
jgi:hypothetical protein